jgi:hypothetical protein
MSQSLIIVKEVRLNNHCPECYSKKDLVLTFKQKFVENTFYKAFTNNIIHSLSCTKCNTEIFPVRWTDDIEQVVDYHIRATHPKPKSLKLKGLTWVLIVLLMVIALGIVFFDKLF